MKITPLEPWIGGKIGRPPTRENIGEYQLQKLRDTLRLVRERSLFYREHLASAPQDISGLEDLARLPFTTAGEIRGNDLRFLCVSQSEIERVVTLQSSGTSGPPKRLYFTGDDQELTLDFFHVGMSTLVEPGDRVLILLPGERPGSVGDMLYRALPRFGVCGIKHGPVSDVAETLDAIVAQKANSLVGIPTQLLTLARYKDSAGKAGPLRLKSVLLATDHAPEAIRRALERAWGCRTYEHYGMTEMGLGGGVECQARRGYHLREADLYFEIVDPQTGGPLADGEMGEVVFTTLTRRGMPLVRYRTGDLSRFLPGDCPCGTALKTLEQVRSRVGGYVEVGGGRLAMADLDEALFPLDDVLNFSARLTAGKGRDCLQIEVEAAQGAGSGLASEIRLALDSIPAIRSAGETGRLEVSLEVQSGRYTGASGPAKRTIADARGRGAG